MLADECTYVDELSSGALRSVQVPLRTQAGFAFTIIRNITISGRKQTAELM